MLRISVILCLLMTFGDFADHDTFKDCARVNFCNTLRTRAPENKYKVDPKSVSFDADLNQLTLTLTTDGTNLTVLGTILEDTIRIQIQEVDSQRYQLEDVLDLPLKTSDIPPTNVTLGDDIQTIVLGDYKVVVTSDFSIEFYRDDSLQVVLDGTRLTFDPTLDQAFTLGLTFPQASQLYGIHEHAEHLALQTTKVNGTDPYRLRNLDVAGFELNSPMAVYGAVPVLYSHGPNGTNGVFLHNAAEQWYEVTNGNKTEVYIMVESGSLDLFVLLGPTPKDVVRQYVGLTGTAHLPQLWTLGYHQSRWNYVSQDDLKDVVANFTTFNFPLDVIWLDIDYTDEKKYFTWDPETFSDPLEMQKNISEAHKRLVTIIDPHIKVEVGYPVYDGALEKDLFVKTSNGSVFQGNCWPGLSSYIDFLNPEARDFYSSFYSYENFPSTTSVLSGIWNDMNEPSVFDDSIEKTLPGDSLHFGGVPHRDIHNIYGLLHTKSTHQGLINRDKGATRPFILTRSHFAGTQRYSAIWTGDNQAEWGYLAVSYSQCLDANLLGIVFCGSDVGGFSQDPSVELLQRWYQAGAWLPFFRAHSDNGSKRREPFLFDENVQKIIRKAIQTRYQHLPVWYTLFYEHTRNRDPVIRPVFYQYPKEIDGYDIDDQLLLGQDILVKAVTESAVTSVPVYFPGGSDEAWISQNDGHVYAGEGFVNISVDIEEIPVFYRRGSVVVRKDTPRLSTDEMANDGHSLYVSLDLDGKATGTVYLDDNTSFNYLKKRYNYLRIDVDNVNVNLTKIDDDADSVGFEFHFYDIIVNSVIKEPAKGEPGRYVSRRFTKTSSGEKLANLKLNFDKSVSVQLL